MPTNPDLRQRDDESRTVPVITVKDLRPVPSPWSEGIHKSWCVGATVVVEDHSGRSLAVWVDEDLQDTLSAVDQEKDLEVPHPAVRVTGHHRTDGTRVYTWVSDDQEITFAGPAYERAWEAVHDEVNAWIESQEPSVRASLIERRQDFI